MIKSLLISSALFSLRLLGSASVILVFCMLSFGSAFAQVVTLELDSDYAKKYKAAGTVTNNTSEPIDGWLVRMKLGGPIRSVWKGVIVEGESKAAEFSYGISNEDYNGKLEPGESVTFGFIVDPDNGTGPPAKAEVVVNWKIAAKPTTEPVPKRKPAEPSMPSVSEQTESEQQPGSPSQWIYHEKVDGFPSGPKTDKDWKSLFPGTKWANGPDEGRVAVDDEIAHGKGGKSIRVLYPKGGQQSGGSGAQWFIDLNGKHEDLYMSYWVRFE